MRAGFKASNGRGRRFDVRAACQRLTIELYADGMDDAKMLARLRRTLSETIFGDRAISDIKIKTVPR